MPRGISHRVEIAGTETVYHCLGNDTLLDGLVRSGKAGIPIGCRGGGCGICKVAILAGEWEATGATSRAHVTDQDAASGRVLACRVRPLGDVIIRFIGKPRWGAGG